MFHNYIPAHTLVDRRNVLVNADKIVAIEQSPQQNLGKFIIQCGCEEVYYSSHIMVECMFNERWKTWHQHQQKMPGQ